jgi:hypothetical protein
MELSLREWHQPKLTQGDKRLIGLTKNG